MLGQKVWIGVLSSIIISLASMGVSTYSVTRSIQAISMVTSTSISLGQKFNWTVAEVVEVQGNLYAYLGFEGSYLHLARWQNGWMVLSYSELGYSGLPKNVTLTPYILRVYGYIYNLYLTAQFFES